MLRTKARPHWVARKCSVWGPVFVLRCKRRTLLTLWWIPRRPHYSNYGWRASFDGYLQDPGHHEWLCRRGTLASAKIKAVERLHTLCHLLHAESTVVEGMVREALQLKKVKPKIKKVVPRKKGARSGR